MEKPNTLDLIGMLLLELIVWGSALAIAGMLFAASGEFLLRLGMCGVFTILGTLSYHRYIIATYTWRNKRRLKALDGKSTVPFTPRQPGKQK